MDLAYCERCEHWYIAKENYEPGDYVLSRVTSIGDQINCSEVGLYPSCAESFKNWMNLLKKEKDL